MLQQFSVDWKLYQKDFFRMLALALGAGLFGMVMTCVIMTVGDGGDTWFCLGTVMAATVLCVIIAIFYAFSYGQEFQLALSMGVTRSAFMGAYVLRMLCQLVVGYGVVLLLHGTELFLYPRWFAGFENDYYLYFLTDWRVVLPALGAVTVLGLFLGALYARYGRKGLWCYYTLWMFCCLVLPRMFHVSAQDTGILNRLAYWTTGLFRAIPVAFRIGFGGIVAGGMVTAVVCWGRRQMVR